MNRQQDMTPEDEPRPGQKCPICSAPEKNEAAGQEWKWCSIVDVSGDDKIHKIMWFLGFPDWRTMWIVTNCNGKYRKRFPEEAYDSQGKKRQAEGQMDG